MHTYTAYTCTYIRALVRVTQHKYTISCPLIGLHTRRSLAPNYVCSYECRTRFFFFSSFRTITILDDLDRPSPRAVRPDINYNYIFINPYGVKKNKFTSFSPPWRTSDRGRQCGAAVGFPREPSKFRTSGPLHVVHVLVCLSVIYLYTVIYLFKYTYVHTQFWDLQAATDGRNVGATGAGESVYELFPSRGTRTELSFCIFFIVVAGKANGNN